MNAARALEVFRHIDDPRISAVEKAMAVRFVADLPTHSLVRKEDLVSALRWAITLLFDET